MANASLHQAKRAKQDEFYTQYNDITAELWEYTGNRGGDDVNLFEGKTVFLNCDDPEWSNFWRYFANNFDDIGLKRLISTHYDAKERTYKLVMERDDNGEITTTKTTLRGNGDFRSAECIELLDEADIVCTNPPFSLFREYLAQLMEHKKKFLIIGNQNAINYKEVFPLLKENAIWLGVHNGAMEFEVPSDYTKIKRVDNSDPENPHYYAQLGNICWFTNLDHKRRHEFLSLGMEYNEKDYPKYENYDAIEVGRIDLIPINYFGVMGVPLSFLTKHCPEQFEIRGMASGNSTKNGFAFDVPYAQHSSDRGGVGIINGRRKYARILIQRVSKSDMQSKE